MIIRLLIATLPDHARARLLAAGQVEGDYIAIDASLAQQILSTPRNDPPGCQDCGN